MKSSFVPYRLELVMGDADNVNLEHHGRFLERNDFHFKLYIVDLEPLSGETGQVALYCMQTSNSLLGAAPILTNLFFESAKICKHWIIGRPEIYEMIFDAVVPGNLFD